jgi:all-trans-retinol 13,14-reductase
MTGQPYRKDALAGEHFDAIVIGSGIGGLTTAALLTKAGKRILILERHYTAGGFTHTFKRKGYEWDVGVHYVGEVHRKRSIHRRIFDDITDGGLEWSRMPEVYERIFFPDRTYELPAGQKRFKEQLIEYFPLEREAIGKYIHLVNDVRNSAAAYFKEKAFPSWMGRVARYFLSTGFLRHAWQTTREVLSALTSNRSLIGVLTAQYGDYGLPPGQSSFAMHALLVRHYMDGGSYPVGGAANIAGTIVPVIERAGGVLKVHAEVETILVEGKRAIGVRLSNGDEIRAGLVISDAGVINTFGKLIDPRLRARLGLDRWLRKVRPATCHNCLYVGLRGSVSELGLPQSNYWIYPDYDHDANLSRFVKDQAAALPVTYISFPSAKDPDWERRHPGRSTIEVLSFVPYEWFQPWEGSRWKRREEAYEVYKAEWRERLLSQLCQYVPGARASIDYSELSSPLTTKHFSNHPEGAIYGIEHTPERFELHWLRPHTPVANLFLTGQDIVTGGVAGGLFSGVLTTSAILRRNVLQDIIGRTAGGGLGNV